MTMISLLKVEKNLLRKSGFKTKEKFVERKILSAHSKNIEFVSFSG